VHTFQLKRIFKIQQAPNFYRMILSLMILIAPPLFSAEHAAILPEHITQYGCQSCHALDIQRHAPSFQSIADRYRTTPDAKLTLAKKLRTGAVGAWGNVPMPPQAMLSDKEIQDVVGWVLKQKSKTMTLNKN
jgi:cytochrome c